jgi:hypothetical protein
MQTCEFPMTNRPETAPGAAEWTLARVLEATAALLAAVAAAASLIPALRASRVSPNAALQAP